MEEFNEITKTKKDFEIVGVRGDGACLYRSIIRFLVDYQKYLNENEYFYKIFDDIKINEKEASRNLQEVLKNWIVEHQYDTLDPFMNIDGTIGDLVIIDHEYIENIDVYNALYSIFAGENDFFIDEEDNNNVCYIPTRWGGVSEIYAFYKIFGVKINQWVLRKWNKRKDEMEICADENVRGCRFLKIQTIGNGNDSENETLEMNILYYDNGNESTRHYVYLRDNSLNLKKKK